MLDPPSPHCIRFHLIPFVIRLVATLTSTFLLVSCAATNTAREPLAPPSLDLSLRHFAGTVLSGARPVSEVAKELEVDGRLHVRYRVRYLRSLRTDGLAPLATRTRLVVASRGEEPLTPVAHVTTGACVGQGEAARALVDELTATAADHRTLADEVAVLAPGLTTSFRARSRASVREDERRSAGIDGVVETADRRHVEILVSIEPGSTEPVIALQIDDVVATPTPRVLRRQVVLLQDTPEIDGEPLVMVMPSPFILDRGRAFLVEVFVTRVEDPKDPEHVALLAACRLDLLREGLTAQKGQARFDDAQATGVSLATSLAALETAQYHRAGMVHLARSTNAGLALDVALSADDATLAALIQRIGPRVSAKSLEKPAEKNDVLGRATLGWAIERAAYELLAERLDDNALPIGMAGILTQHAGEVGRDSGSIRDVLQRCGKLAELAPALEAENFAFLESAEPGARLRAFDWLRARGTALDEFDPLGPRKARRTALERVSAARDAAARDAAARDAAARRVPTASEEASK